MQELCELGLTGAAAPEDDPAPCQPRIVPTQAEARLLPPGRTWVRREGRGESRTWCARSDPTESKRAAGTAGKYRISMLFVNRGEVSCHRSSDLSRHRRACTRLRFKARARPAGELKV